MAIEKHFTYEDAKETARKVRKSLKEVFPGSKFKVATFSGKHISAIDVHHVGGVEPHRETVEKLCLGYSSAATGPDGEEVTGYEQDGVLYYGADMVRYQGSDVE